MNIYINEKKADIALDTEKVLGDVIFGIEAWISPSGCRIKTICVDNEEKTEDELEEAFKINIKSIQKLELTISSWRELAAEALTDLYQVCAIHEGSIFNERSQIVNNWKMSPGARFLESDIADIFILANRAFEGSSITTTELKLILEERHRELGESENEIKGCEPQVKAIASRLEELPLDMQTGKDKRAAETIQLFSAMGEKLFRIFLLYKSEGLSLDTFMIGDANAKLFMEEFNSTLKELTTAYENRDTVLVGDIAEYELSPKLLKLYNALYSLIKSGSPIL